MGVLFSRPGRGDGDIPAGAFPAGDLASAKSPSIEPFLGINTGNYGDTPTRNLPPIPLEWIVSPRDVDESCPNGSSLLAWFAITEGIIVAVAILVAHRSFIYHVSRRLLGRRKNSVWLTWTIPFICQLIANVSIAGLVSNSPGYDHLNAAHILTVYLARPRFYFVALALLRALVTVRRSSEWDKTKIIQRSRDNRLEFPYADAWITTALSELLLLIVVAIFTGVTWNRMPSRSEARNYIQDHVSYMSAAPAIMLLCMVIFIPVFMRYGEAFPVQAHYGESGFRAQGRRYNQSRHWGATVNRTGEARIKVKTSTNKKSVAIKRTVSSVVGCIFLGFVCLIQWSYWTRFLEMSGVLFCPPKLIESGAVWVVFTALGLLAGAAS